MFDQFPVFSVRSVSCVQCSIRFVCSSVRSVSCIQCSISFVCSVFDQFRVLSVRSVSFVDLRTDAGHCVPFQFHVLLSNLRSGIDLIELNELSVAAGKIGIIFFPS